MNATLKNIIRTLQLKPHPEGGYFRETYRSNGVIIPESLSAEFSGKRNYFTCIYFLLPSETFSAFHRIIQDETWHFYDGSPLCLHMISAQGS
jgi:predicted cupin superfamily sugar epimerase